MEERGIGVTVAVIITAIVVGIVVGVGTWALVPSKVAKVEKPGEGLRFDFINQASGEDPVFAAVKQGIKDFCEPMGIKFVSRSAEGDVSKVPRWIDDAVAAGSDGIILSAWIPELIEDSVVNAINSGVPVVSTIIDPGGSRTAFVGVGDLHALGEMKAEPLDPYLSEGSKVLAVHEEISMRSLAYKDAAIEHWENDVGIHVEVTDLEATNDIATIESRVLAELTAHPGEYDAILAMGGVTTAGSVLAEKDAGLEPGELPITGLDFLAPTIDGIREGYVIGVVSWQPYESGYIPAAILYPLVKWELEPPSEIWTGIKWIDKTNLDEQLHYIDVDRW